MEESDCHIDDESFGHNFKERCCFYGWYVFQFCLGLGYRLSNIALVFKSLQQEALIVAGNLPEKRTSC